MAAGGALALILTLYLDHEGINKSFHRSVFVIFYVALTAAIAQTKLKPLGYVLSFVLSTSLCTSLANHYWYSSPFNEAFAWSLLETNKAEFFSMATVFWPVPILLAALVVCIRCLSMEIAMRANRHSKKWLGLFFALGVLVVLTAVEASIKTQKTNAIYHPSSAALRKTVFHNFSYFLDSIERQKYLAATALKTYSHNLSKSVHNATPTIVVLIGESASREHHSIYGYSHQTTPGIESLSSESIIFEQAIAPAAYTLLSVPLSLSTAKNDPATHHLMMDSIVKLANTIGYSTYWISTQGQSGPDDSTIAAIAQNAKHQYWLSGPDERVLDALDDVIKTDNSGQKLIFIHINGSHEPPCGKVAPDALKFSNDDREDSCYDTTIWNTDKLLQRISTDIKNTPSALLYFSDHGLIKRRGQYVHASGVPPQQAVNVPMYVWFSPHIRHSLRGTRIQGRYGTMHNYYLIADLMGVYVDQQVCLSALSACYDFSAPIVISDTSGSTYQYSTLTRINPPAPQ